MAVMGCLTVAAQDQKGITLSGSIQSDVLLPKNDKETGAEKTEDFQTNTYADLLMQSKHVDAGVRMEYMEHPLPGFENDFKGWGVPNFWVKGKLDKIELTAGTFYEQFGSGFILRTYEERSLGIDNSLLGARLVAKPIQGITLKALSGKQRRYWNWNKSLISGADAEVHLNEWLPSLQQSGTELMVGASWVNKYEEQEEVLAPPTYDYKYNFPEFVNAWDVRATLNKGPWSLLAEYAQKTQDPSYDNQYSYEKGTAVLLSGSYSKKGLSLLLQGKRSENMSFRSRRTMMGTSSFLNHLPAFTQDHTYALAALYPYATQLDGEWAWQAEGGYNFKRKTALGGKYGMNVKVNFSHVRWEGVTYYQDLDVQVTRKMSQAFKLTLMYMNQRYNMSVIEGGEGGMVDSNIFIADGKYQFSPKVTLRGEVQYLATKDDQGDWAYGLLELSLAPHWMLSASDMYNVSETHIHYYQCGVTFSTGAHRLQVGYGRTRAGYNCSGGVCRYVPATCGLTASYNYSF